MNLKALRTISVFATQSPYQSTRLFTDVYPNLGAKIWSFNLLHSYSYMVLVTFHQLATAALHNLSGQFPLSNRQIYQLNGFYCVTTNTNLISKDLIEYLQIFCENFRCWELVEVECLYRSCTFVVYRIKKRRESLTVDIPSFVCIFPPPPPQLYHSLSVQSQSQNDLLSAEEKENSWKTRLPSYVNKPSTPMG